MREVPVALLVDILHHLEVRMRVQVGRCPCTVGPHAVLHIEDFVVGTRALMEGVERIVIMAY